MKRRTLFSLLVLLLSVLLFAFTYIQTYGGMDSSSPVIVMDEEEIEVSIYDSEDVLLEGVTATDAGDGDVSDSLVVESISDFVEENTRIVNYAAFDSDNHVSKAFRRIVYTDYTSIQLTLDAALRFPVSSSTIDVFANMTAIDCMDGDISSKFSLSMGSSIEVDLAGDYSVVIQVTNSAGDTLQVPVTVTIYDQSVENASPRFKLTDYLIYVDKGETIDAISYIESVTVSGTEYEVTSKGTGTYGVDTSDMDSEELSAFRERDPQISADYITVDNPVDTSTAGVYEILYSMQDEDGDTGSIRLIVIVEE